MSRNRGPEDWEWEHRIELIKKGKLSPSPKPSQPVPQQAPPPLDLGLARGQEPLFVPEPYVPTTVTRLHTPAHVHVSSRTPLLVKRAQQRNATWEIDCCVIM